MIISLNTILLIILVLALISALPAWPYSRSWGYFAVDPANGRIIYGLIGRRDRYFAVPWSVVSVSADGHSALIRGRADDFRDEVGFQPDRAPDLVGKVLTREIHVRFNTKPYWKNSSEEAP